MTAKWPPRSNSDQWTARRPGGRRVRGYEDNPAHRRARLLRLTPAGRDAPRTIQATQRRWAAA